jgi:2-keto-4-pentenoate hydratase/2-oxohepta-3-ene-1,7-dioic acid hydratase in catechol pathway
LKLLTFSTPQNPRTRAGAFDGSRIVDLAEAYRASTGAEAPSWFDSVSQLLMGGEQAQALARQVLGNASKLSPSAKPGKDGGDPVFYDPAHVIFRPVVTGTPKVFCVTVNYAAHGAAYSTKPLEEPYVFIKFPNILTGHKQPVLLGKTSGKADSEIELGVIIGKGGKYISRDKAFEHVAGYTVFNDFSFRDRRINKSDPSRINWLHLKNLDTSAPIGPWLVTKDEIKDPKKLTITLQVNDSAEDREAGSTDGMVHSIPALIEYISNGVTLEPGDIISTGTPLSVAFGRDRYLKDGDVVKAEIEGIGTLINPMKAEA